MAEAVPEFQEPALDLSHHEYWVSPNDGVRELWRSTPEELGAESPAVFLDGQYAPELRAILRRRAIEVGVQKHQDSFVWGAQLALYRQEAYLGVKPDDRRRFLMRFVGGLFMMDILEPSAEAGQPDADRALVELAVANNPNRSVSAAHEAKIFRASQDQAVRRGAEMALWVLNRNIPTA